MLGRYILILALVAGPASAETIVANAYFRWHLAVSDLAPWVASQEAKGIKVDQISSSDLHGGGMATIEDGKTLEQTAAEYEKLLETKIGRDIAKHPVRYSAVRAEGAKEALEALLADPLVRSVHIIGPKKEPPVVNQADEPLNYYPLRSIRSRRE